MKEQLQYMLDTIAQREKENGSYAECLGRLSIRIKTLLDQLDFHEKNLSVVPEVATFRFREGLSSHDQVGYDEHGGIRHGVVNEDYWH